MTKSWRGMSPEGPARKLIRGKIDRSCQSHAAWRPMPYLSPARFLTPNEIMQTAADFKKLADETKAALDFIKSGTKTIEDLQVSFR